MESQNPTKASTPTCQKNVFNFLDRHASEKLNEQMVMTKQEFFEDYINKMRFIITSC